MGICASALWHVQLMCVGHKLFRCAFVLTNAVSDTTGLWCHGTAAVPRVRQNVVCCAMFNSGSLTLSGPKTHDLKHTSPAARPFFTMLSKCKHVLGAALLVSSPPPPPRPTPFALSALFIFGPLPQICCCADAFANVQSAQRHLWDSSSRGETPSA